MKDVTACAVRELSGGKLCNIFRFIHDEPDEFGTILNKWVATPKTTPLTGLLFSFPADRLDDYKESLELYLKAK